MKKAGKENKKLQWLKAGAAIIAIAVWVAIPVITGKVAASDSVVIAVRTANLVSPTGSVNPHGAAEWQLEQSGNRELEVEVEDLSFAAGTNLTVIIDGTTVGQAAVDTRGKAKLKLRTEDGQAVPNVTAGSLVDVRNGGTTIVRGLFSGLGPSPSPTTTPTGSPTASPSASPTASPSPSGSPSPSPTITPGGSPSPSPSPAATPNAGDLFAGLSGPTLNGVLPNGFAEFELHSSRTELEIRIRQVNLPIGTSLNVFVNDISAGSLVLTSGGEGRLRLRSDRGEVVPAIVSGSTISIRNGAASILSGVFAGFTASPSPTPTGTPTQVLGRSFEAHLTGNQATPQVNTSATGEIKVNLNASETEASVFGEFHNLSSNQTAARVETTVGTTTTVFDLGVVGGTNGNFRAATFPVSAAQVQALRSGTLSAVIASINNPAGEIRGRLQQHSRESDFDGDGGHDLAVFRPSTNVWFAQNTAGFSAQRFGNAGDTVVSGDYDGDGRTDTAVFTNSGGQGVWQISRSSDGGVTTADWGLATDVPVRGDFDGDGRADIAVWRRTTGVWFIQKSDNSGNTYQQFGQAGDIPMPSDMDGDGRDDITVFRPADGNWYWLRSSDGQFTVVHFGQPGDIPVRGDFDGDGKKDLTVFRPSNGVWYTLESSSGRMTIAQFGMEGDIPVAGSYDGDGKTDIAVFRPSEGNWYILQSSNLSFQAVHFGLNGDIPLIAR